MSAAAPAVAMPVARDPARAAAPLLLGALVGAMVAARFETVLLCVGAASAAAAYAGARRPPARWFAALAAGGGLSVLLNLYLNPGRVLPLPDVLGTPATREGLARGVLLALRMVGAFTALHGLAAAWPGERAVDELARRAAPLRRFGLPVEDARMVMALAIRFAPLIAEEIGRLARLQDLRAGRPPRNALERLARRRAVAVPAFVCALERAERIALALEARHYRERPPADRTEGAGAWGWIGVALAGVALLWRS